MDTLWAALIVPGLASAMLIAFIRGASWSRHLADLPNERSLHSMPMPRIGGIGVMVASLPFVAAQGSSALTAIAACAGFLAVISLLDDVRSLPIEVRLPAHFAAAAIALLSLGALPAIFTPWVDAVILTIGIVWMANLYNFMDGSDGLAGGMAVIGFGAMGYAAWVAGATSLALAAAAIASAATGFLMHNSPPARVFLGDCGSVPLGFLAAVLGIMGASNGAWPFWFPLLVFSPFIVDASVTLLRRIVNHERFWTAHRSHSYQRLVLSGWSRARLAFSAYALMIAVAVSALLALKAGREVQCAIILVWIAIHAALLVAIGRRVKASVVP